MTNPVLDALIHHRVAEIVDPPRSWDHEMKKLFLTLPRQAQTYLAARESDRDREVRRSQNERAAAVKRLEVLEAKLAATEDRLERAIQKLKEKENVESTETTAA
jgi:hypothetical protein